MKNTINILTLVFAVITGSVFANEAPATTAVVGNAFGIYKVIYKATEANRVKICIASQKDGIIFSEILSNQESFIRPYNFNGMAEGEYTITIEDKNGKSVEKVNYKLNKVESIIQISKLATDSNKYLLTATSNGADVIQVTIFDSFSNVLYENTVNVNGKFSLVYDLNKVKGNPTFVVVGTTGDKKVVTY